MPPDRSASDSPYQLEVIVKLYPLLFAFRDLIAGNGFVASVAMDGRVLLAEEDDNDVWMFGVQPGGIAGGDRQRDAAFREFKQSYLTVLYDIAAEAASYEEFQAKTQSFFDEVNAVNLDEWKSALAEVRRTSASLENLKTVNADSCLPSLVIEKVAPEKIKPNANELDRIAEAA